jgi:hypothetical protein
MKFLVFAVIMIFALSIMSNLSFSSTLVTENSVVSLKPFYVNMTEPYVSTLYNNSTVYLGKVAPGQTFYIKIFSGSLNSKNQFINLGWNQLVAYGLPKGWIIDNSSLYDNYLSVEIKAAPSASYGIYKFKLKAINFGNMSGLGNSIINSEINVSDNVINVTMPYNLITTDPFVYKNVYIIINNTGVSDNPFIITSTGLPDTSFNESVIAVHGRKSEIAYPIYLNTQGIYKLNLSIKSATSPEVERTEQIKIIAKSNPYNNYLSVGSGSPIFPIIYAPLEAVMYFISLLIKLI